MYPDGGIARFRLYGVAVPVWPGAQPDGSEPEVELSAAAMGGVATECSDEHFGAKENLLWPGRGKDMGDGWETRRSRERGHVDWVVVRLGARGKVSRLVVDTAHFRGNYPQAVRVEATDAEEEGGLGWVPVLAEQKLGPDAEHEFGGEVLQHTERAYTHFRMLILPDGGVKRFRVFGTRV
ncbi:Allantoicase [Loxospora ochrophaea]|nr:Allantoicase [Loxospora ochrophaea]